MKIAVAIAAISLGLASFVCAAAEKDERGGTCEDAKSQYRYFCDKEGFKDDIFLKSPVACNNAKRNVKAACDGISEEDYAYEFKEGTPSQ